METFNHTTQAFHPSAQSCAIEMFKQILSCRLGSEISAIPPVFMVNNEVEPHVKIMFGMLSSRETKSNDDCVKSFWCALLFRSFYFLFPKLCVRRCRWKCLMNQHHNLWNWIYLSLLELKAFFCYLLRAFFYASNDLWGNWVRYVCWCFLYDK